MLKPLVPKFRPDQPVRLKDIAEKQVPAKLKQILGTVNNIHYSALFFMSCAALPV